MVTIKLFPITHTTMQMESINENKNAERGDCKNNKNTEFL